jgi:hypothetical protein
MPNPLGYESCIPRMRKVPQSLFARVPWRAVIAMVIFAGLALWAVLILMLMLSGGIE